MKCTRAIVFSLYYAAIEADEAWSANLAEAGVDRWSKKAHTIAGYDAKLRADSAHLAALALMRKSYNPAG